MRADGDVKSRLFAILHQILAKTMRRQRFRSVTGAMTVQYPNETGYKPERKEAGRQDHLLRGLDHLPERQRSVVLLISVENLTYTETATVLGISSRTVMEQLANGRERLRQTNAGLSPESGIIA
jgi:RNA polymerase sigma-70 factor (ECF subfamily)